MRAARSTLVVLAFVACACDRSPAPAPDPNVRVLDLPTMDMALPEAPGKSLFVGTCTSCHSARYIADQPTYPRKTWTAEVEKMNKAYGAAVAPESATAIVDYLVATHGRED
jgi:cytochrome c5